MNQTSSRTIIAAGVIAGMIVITAVATAIILKPVYFDNEVNDIFDEQEEYL